MQNKIENSFAFDTMLYVLINDFFGLKRVRTPQ